MRVDNVVPKTPAFPNFSLNEQGIIIYKRRVSIFLMIQRSVPIPCTEKFVFPYQYILQIQ